MNNWPIHKYIEGDCRDIKIRLTTPAHSGKMPYGTNYLSISNNIFHIDCPYVDRNIIKESEYISSKLFNTSATFYFTTGVSHAVMIAIRALSRHSEEIILSRNIHKSALNEIILSKKAPIWLMPSQQPWFVYTDKDIHRICEKNRNAKVIVLTNPSYEGHVSPIDKICNACRQHGLYIIIDESLGTLWKVSPYLPKSALECDCDIVIHSLHKRAGALVPTGLLHIPQKSRISVDQICDIFHLFQPSSTSNLLLLSIESTIALLFSQELQSRIKETIYIAEDIRYCLNEFENVLISSNETNCSDPLTLHLFLKSGENRKFADSCYDFGIDYELADNRGVTYFINPFLSQKQLLEVKKILINTTRYFPCKTSLQTPIFYNNPKMVLAPHSAYFSDNLQSIELHRAIGLIASKSFSLCPPGIPVLIPGERISSWHKRMLSPHMSVVICNVDI